MYSRTFTGHWTRLTCIRRGEEGGRQGGEGDQTYAFATSSYAKLTFRVALDDSDIQILKTYVCVSGSPRRSSFLIPL